MKNSTRMSKTTPAKAILAPLSFEQERMFLLDSLAPGNPANNICGAIEISGELNLARLENNLNVIIQRHEILRTSFAIVDGEPQQTIAPPFNVKLPVVDLQNLAPEKRPQEAKRLTTQVAQHAFNLRESPLWRVCLLRLEATKAILVLNMHHSICDGDWSLGIFFREIASLYDSLSPLQPLPIQYQDFARIQRAALTESALAPQLAYWRQQLGEHPPVLQLPTDHRRPAMQTYAGGSQEFVLDKPLTESLRRLSQQADVPLFVTLLTVFKTLLYRYTGQEEIAVGSPVSGRSLADTEHLIGYFGNPLVLRTDMAGNLSFRDVLLRVSEMTKQAAAHQAFPFQKLAQALYIERDMSFSPLFQALFVLRDNAQHSWKQPLMPALTLKTLTFKPLDVENPAVPYDIFLSIKDLGEELIWSWQYNTDLFESETITRLLTYCQNLIQAIVVNPDEQIGALPMLAQAAREELLFEWNKTQTPYLQRPVHQLFEAQAQQTLDDVAVLYPIGLDERRTEQQLTYRQLNQRSNQLAYYLQKLGVKPEESVGICIERSLEMPVAILGILKAGGAYVPLDVSYPIERLTYMLANAEIKTLVTTEKLLRAVPEIASAAAERACEIVRLDVDALRIGQESAENPTSAVQLGNLAYVLYTSGSTGQPKGVAMEHRALSNLINWHLENRLVGRGVRMLQFSSISFDISFHEIFATWCSGGTLVLISEETRRNPLSLLEFIAQQEIEKVYLPFIALQQLAEAAEIGDVPTKLREVITAGEQLHITPAVARFFAKTRTKLHNHYGGTEIQDVTAFTLTGNPESWPAIPSIGRPISNLQTYILDQFGQPVPIGVTGELFVSGDGLARGYVNHPDLTIERFLPNPFGTGHLYKTNDSARYLPNGDIEHLGRIDSLVKIRGFRIEPGEVETVLSRYPDVQECAVIPREDVPGQKQLVAYIVPTHQLASQHALDEAETIAQIQGFLKERLPEYMVPARIVMLDKMPLSPSGKLNRAGLPVPSLQVRAVESLALSTDVSLKSDIEKKIMEVWQELLQINAVGIRDNFFFLGGNSLLLVQAHRKLSETFAVELPTIALFQRPTVETLAQLISELQETPKAVVSKNGAVNGAYHIKTKPALKTGMTVSKLLSEAAFDDTIQDPNGFAAPTREPRAIFLTGVTGFLGPFLLNELLRQTQATIYCLVRNSPTLEAGNLRIQRSLERYSLPYLPFKDRIIPVIGDLSQPHLGMQKEQFSRLAGQIDLIYHAGALVNLLYSYSEVRATNVDGIKEILKLAGAVKLKPVHYISSTGIFEALGYAGKNKRIREDEPLENCEVVFNGYPQSKWVAEKILQLAQMRGFPVSIYRPGMVTGHSKTGVVNTDDILCRLLKHFVQYGIAPDMEIQIDMTPVDYASQAIVHLSRQADSLGKVFHLVNPRALSLGELIQEINALGYPLAQVDYAHWLSEIRAQAQGPRETALGAMLHVLAERIAENDLTYLEFSSIGMCFDCQNTLDGLQNTGIACPPVDAKLLKTYFSFFEQSNFLN